MKQERKNMKKYRPKKFNVENKPIIIADSSYNDEIVQYRCEPCGLLIGLRRSNISDKQEIECSHCKNIIAIANARKLSKLTTPHRNIEPAIISVPFPNYKDVAIHHELPLEWGAKSLSQKGTIRFTSYEER